MDEQQVAAPQPQPSIIEQFTNVVKNESGGPRDERGKFVSTKAEAKPDGAQPVEEAPKEEAEATTEETTEESSQPEIRKHKLKVKTDDGADEEIEVDEEELKRGYMKSKDYSVKTAQVAREREAIQAKVREAVEPKVKEYADKLQMAEQLILQSVLPDFQNVDMDRLAVENPAEWASKFQKLQKVQAQLGHIQAEKARLAAQADEETQKTLQKQIREAHEVLTTEIPDWSKETYGKILDTGKQYGFKPEEVNAITDPRAIKVLNDARLWREFKAKPAATKKVDVPKVVKPGTAEKPDPKSEARKAQMDQLKKSGNSKDAMPFFLGMAKALKK